MGKKKFMPTGNCCKFDRCSPIMGLTVVEPHGLKVVADGDWIEIDVKVDSGATETVIPEAVLAGVIGVTEGAAFKRGVQFEVAKGTLIPNLGERRFVGFTEDGTANGVVAQVCDVNQTLMSVSKMTRKGNRVVFDEAGSYVEDKATGVKTWMTEEGGMYSLKMWVSRKSAAEAGFSGRGPPARRLERKERCAVTRKT